MKMSRGCMYRCFHVLQLLKFWGLAIYYFWVNYRLAFIEF